MSRATISVLGSTGSIGRNTLDVIRQNPRFEVYALSAHRNIELLLDQCKMFQPRYTVVTDEINAVRFAKLLESSNCKTELLRGNGSLERIASDDDVEIVMAAIVGAAGLESTLAAVAAGKRVLLANKECTSAVLEVSTEGLAKVNFKIDEYDSTYHIVAKQDVD